MYVVRFAFTRSLFSNRSSGVHYGGGCRISLFLFRVIFFARATYTPVRIRIPINIHIERIYIYIYIYNVQYISINVRVQGPFASHMASRTFFSAVNISIKTYGRAYSYTHTHIYIYENVGDDDDEDFFSVFYRLLILLPRARLHIWSTPIENTHAVQNIPCLLRHRGLRKRVTVLFTRYQNTVFPSLVYLQTSNPLTHTHHHSAPYRNTLSSSSSSKRFGFHDVRHVFWRDFVKLLTE